MTIGLRAEESGSTSEEELPDNFLGQTDLPEVGLHLDFPYADKKGMFALLGSELPTDREDISIGASLLIYFPVSSEDYEAYSAYCDELENAEMKGEEPPTPKDERWKYTDSLITKLFTVISVTGDCKDDELKQLVSSSSSIELNSDSTLREIGK